MTIEDTKNLIVQIKSFRPFFQTGLSMKEETNFIKNWTKVLEPYDFRDVESSLEKWLKETGHFGKTPEPYELISGLLTIKQKDQLKNKNAIRVKCPICSCSVGLIQLDNHFGKCSSIEFVARTRLKYFNRITDKDKLWDLSDDVFEKLYMKYCTELTKKNVSEDELDALTKVLNSEV